MLIASIKSISRQLIIPEWVHQVQAASDEYLAVVRAKKEQILAMLCFVIDSFERGIDIDFLCTCGSPEELGRLPGYVY